MLNFTRLFKKQNYCNYVNNFCGENFEINNWIVSQFILDRIIPIVGIKPFPLNELQLLVSTVLYFKPDFIIDWGTHVGKSARIFYEIKKYFNLKSKIFSIDLPDNVEHIEHPHNKRGIIVKNIREVKLIQGDGVTEAVKICKKFKNKKCLFLLDGDHEYKTVIRELNTLNKNVNYPIILIHDTFFQTEKAKYNIGPYKAIKKFLSLHKNYNKLSTDLGLPGMTLLYPKL